MTSDVPKLDRTDPGKILDRLFLGFRLGLEESRRLEAIIGVKLAEVRDDAPILDEHIQLDVLLPVWEQKHIERQKGLAEKFLVFLADGRSDRRVFVPGLVMFRSVRLEGVLTEQVRCELAYDRARLGFGAAFWRLHSRKLGNLVDELLEPGLPVTWLADQQQQREQQKSRHGDAPLD